MEIPVGKPRSKPAPGPSGVRPAPQPAVAQPAQRPAAASKRSVPLRAGFVQTFGLDIRVAILAVVVDFLAFGGDIISFGVLYVVELGAAVVLTFVTYKIQRGWYGDDHDSALIKALIIGLLTAIPVPITGIVAGPGGLLGLIHMLRRK